MLHQSLVLFRSFFSVWVKIYNFPNITITAIGYLKEEGEVEQCHISSHIVDLHLHHRKWPGFLLQGIIKCVCKGKAESFFIIVINYNKCIY